MAQTLSPGLLANGRREPVQSSAAGTQAGMGGVSSTSRTPETQMFRCPRKRGNFSLEHGLKGSPVLDCAGKTGPPLRWFTPSQTSAGKWYQANMGGLHDISLFGR